MLIMAKGKNANFNGLRTGIRASKQLFIEITHLAVYSLESRAFLHHSVLYPKVER